MVPRLRRAFRARYPLTLYRAIALMLAMVVLPLVVGCVALVVVQWRQERASVEQQMNVLATQLAHAVDLHYSRGAAQLEAVSALPDVFRSDRAAVYDYVVRVVADRPGTIVGLVGPDGQLLINSAFPLSLPLPNLWALEREDRQGQWAGHALPLSSQGMSRRAFEQDVPAYSGLYLGASTGVPTLALAIPVSHGGPPDYVLSMTFPAEDLRAVLATAALPPEMLAVVVDGARRVVVSNDPVRYPTGLRLPPDASDPTGRVRRLHDETGQAIPTADAPTHPGLAVLLGLPPGVAYSSAGEMAVAWAALLLGALALSMAGAAWLSNRFAGPLRELAASARQGRAPVVGSTGVVELDDLAQALDKAAQAERRHYDEQVRRIAAEQRQDAVRASEHRIRNVFDSLYCFVGVLDQEGRVMEANRTSRRRAGLAREDVVGVPFWDCFWWSHDPAVQQQLREAFGRALRGQTVRYDVEVRLEGGRLVPIDFQIAPLLDDAGAVHEVVVSAVDIEERVEANRRVDEQRWLLDAALEATPAGIVVTDAAGGVLRVNQANAQLWGILEAAGAGRACPLWRGCWSSGHAREGQALEPAEWPIARALRHGRRETSVIDIEPFDAAATRRTVLMSASPVLDKNGDVVGGVVVQIDITDRVRAEASLREADRNKDAFLATLGHELRNPLAPIRTATEILRRSPVADPMVLRAREVIERQVQHMVRLVDDLLDVSRITRGLVRIEREPVSLQAVAALALEAAAPAVSAAGVRLELQLAAEPLGVRGDLTRLAQSLLNLLTNACKFSPQGARVALALRRQGECGVFEVSDQGVGLSPDSLERIFGLFVQEQPSGGGGNTGLGIGLALARQLVRMHGGDVVAASDGPGRGSTFTLTLPLTAVELEVPVPDATAPPASADPLAVQVLVVDDNHDGCDALCELLALAGFRVVAAYDAAGALAALEARPFEAVVLDIGLPDLSGYELCRRLRERFGAGPVMVALTGWGQPQDKRSARRAGFDAHVTKPADPQALAALLQRLLQQRRQGVVAPECVDDLY